jgi:hypothetical protein
MTGDKRGAPPLKNAQSGDLDSLNAAQRAKPDGAQAIRRAIEVTIEKNARRRRQQEPSVSKGLRKKPGPA